MTHLGSRVSGACLVLFYWLLFWFDFGDETLVSAVSVRGGGAWNGVDKGKSSGSSLDLATNFLTLDDAVEMSYLSLLIYGVRHEIDDVVACNRINNKNYTTKADDDEGDNKYKDYSDLHCHWYLHDQSLGTQVMIISSVSKQYTAVVFAGTDDVKTALTDIEIITKPFAEPDESGLLIHIDDPKVKIHEGFNEAVFGNRIFEQLVQQLDPVRDQYPHHRLLATGHSLGGANSIITSVALTLYYRNQYDIAVDITSISFGCPYIGNEAWRDYVHSNHTDSPMKNLGIWRFVLGWDLIPRLPEMMKHVGHTIQFEDADNATTAVAYYEHYGDHNLHYSGVPFGWDAKPYFWVPGALFSHRAYRYWKAFYMQSKSPPDASHFVRQFEIEKSTPNNNNNNNNDHGATTDDDHFFWSDDLFHDGQNVLIQQK